MRILIAMLVLCLPAYAGVRDGETYDTLGGGTATTHVTGGVHGDYPTSVGAGRC